MINEKLLFFQLEVVDRSLLPGDIVRWADEGNGPMKGYIDSVKVKVNVKVMGTRCILKNILSSNLKPLQV